MTSILVVDDELSMREFLKILLEEDGFAVTTVGGGAEALALLGREKFDLVISDIRMPPPDGLALLAEIEKLADDLPVILVTAFASPEDAVLAMKHGAFDYLTKPFKVKEIKSVVRAALARRQEAAAPARQKSPPRRPGFEEIIGASPEMLKIYDIIQRVAPTQANVLIYGESGTGKELAARAIHRRSPAAAHPFVPIVCSAIPETLFESELFGHAKGAFTGANAAKAGLFEQADHGTVFLDEIGELSPLIQTKLLRVLQEREIKRVGGAETIPIHVRIVAATNKDLEEEVIAGRFREDLFYRLAVVPIRMPPLRERKGDVPPLAAHFLAKHAARFGKEVGQISSYAMDVLMAYDFPGNVRELENIIERGVALENSNIILPESLALSIHRQGKNREGLPESAAKPATLSGLAELEAMVFARGLEPVLAELEKGLLTTALKRAGNSKTKAAELLKTTFRSFRYKAKKYGISS